MERYNDEIKLKDILITLSEYKTFLLTKKFKIIIISSLFFGIGLLYSSMRVEKYNAELTFVVEQDTGGPLGSMAGIAGQFGFDFSGSESGTFSQGNIIELLKSRGVIVSALMQNAKVSGKDDLLIEHYLKINSIKEGWLRDDFQGVSFHDNIGYIHDSISGVIWAEITSEHLTIELQSNEANIITLSYLSLQQEFAKAFVESLIAQMSKMYILHQTAQANNTLDFLQDRSDSVFVALEIAEKEFAKVKDINQRIVRARGRLKEIQLMRQVEVLNAMYLEIMKNLEISKITLLNQTPIINIIDKPTLPLEDGQLSKGIAALIGGFLGFFFSTCYFLLAKLFRDALSQSLKES